MTALQTSQAPLMIRLANGQLVPASGGALVDTAAPTPAASVMDDSGALSAHPMAAAGDQGALSPAAAQVAQIIDLAKHRGVAAGGGTQGTKPPTGGLPLPPQPPVLEAPQGSQNDGSAGINAMLRAIGKNSGQSQQVTAPDISPSPLDPTDPSFAAPGLPPATGITSSNVPDTSSPPPPAAPIAPIAGDSSSPGMLDRLKSFLGIGDNAAAAPPVVAPGAAASVTPPLQASAVPAGALSTPAMPPQATAPQGALVDAPVPMARPDLPTDVVPQQVGQPNIGAMVPQPNISAATPAIPQEQPGYFDRLKANPVALALLTGGLGTMAAASRPGATALGSIGEGALGGINTVFGQQAASREAALKEASEERQQANEASEAALRIKQGTYYDTHGAALGENAATNQTYRGALANSSASNAAANTVKAAAASKTADARMIAAQNAANGSKNPTALIKNAQWLVDNKVAPDLATAVGTLRSAARNPGQRAALVTARAKLYLSSSIAPSDADVATAKKRAEADVDSDLQAAAPGKSGGALGGGNSGGGALADAQYAIAHGAPRDKVIQRAKAQGLDTSGL
jgi:hypothetical protein